MSRKTLIARRGASALAGISLLLFATACGASVTKGTPPGGGGGGGGGTNYVPKATALKVCSLIDLAPLARSLHSTGYTFGPKDVPAGVGLEWNGPQCSAQFTLAPLGGTVMVPARLNAAVIAYPTAAEADQQFQDRVKKAADKEAGTATVTELPGEWTKGTIVVSRGHGDNALYALIRKDSYLVKISLQVSSDAAGKAKWPFTLNQTQATVASTAKAFYTSASAKLTA
ncbi:hypothetical protein [Kribbella solani]|uniref:DUF3558 domain-containing protein n=1 Tax=Kribbella solani TaxID=236067 RepID=A0A841DZL2_9ACTN|nr:hypothetical protein [Kribbella solani]MBB5983609.1 hypothetical protein [Kribbella solani]